MNLSIISPKKTICKEGAVSELKNTLLVKNKRVFFVYGSRTLEREGYVEQIEAILEESAREYVSLNVPKGEPDDLSIMEAVKSVRAFSPDTVIALGGGSVIDTGKAASALITNRESLTDYLEGVGRELALDSPAIDFIAIPTTAGTGSEATKNAVISVRKMRMKKSLRSESMVADLVILDPALTLSLNPRVTSLSGFDALAQLIESFVSRKSNFYTDSLCVNGITLLAKSFLTTYEEGSDLSARADMQLASYFSGICLANAGLGAAHGLASGMGGVYQNLSHGLIVAVLLPHVMRLNLKQAEKKLGRVGEMLTGREYINSFEAAVKGIEYIERLKEKMNVPENFKAMDLDKNDIDEVVKNSFGNSLSGNPYEIDEKELKAFIEKLV